MCTVGLYRCFWCIVLYRIVYSCAVVVFVFAVVVVDDRGMAVTVTVTVAQRIVIQGAKEWIVRRDEINST